MHIKGEDLEVVKLDTYQGNITIKGKIDLVEYIDEVNKKESSFLSKLFKWYYFFKLNLFFYLLYMEYFLVLHLIRIKNY